MHIKSLFRGTTTWDAVLVHLGKIALIIVFMAAFVGKIWDPDPPLLFIETLLNLDTGSAKIILVATICFEAFIVLSLLLFSSKKWPFLFSGGILVLFSGVVAYALMINLELSCGCFGPIMKQNALNQYSLIRNLLLAGLSFVLFYQED